MGVCETIDSKKNHFKRQLNQQTQTRDGTYLMSKESSIIKKRNSISSLKEDYLLLKNLVKRDDINKYYKLSSEIIGQGSSGIVCIGENSNGKFAIKRINKSRIKNLNDIIKEVKFSQLKHKNIIKYYEVYEDLKTISFVMEFGQGGDLFDFIVNSPIEHLPLDICIDLTYQILDVLNYIHNEIGICHRDLKPENFMITIDKFNNPVIKLIDFGFATYIPKEGKLLYEFVGTPQYCSPEIVSKYGYNEKTDIWSAGIILFNMITGYEPFKSSSLSSLSDEIKFKTINFEYIHDNKLRSLVEKMLDRQIYKRISSKEAFEIAKKIKEERDKEYIKEIENKSNLKYEKNKSEYEIFWKNFTTKITSPTFLP